MFTDFANGIGGLVNGLTNAISYAFQTYGSIDLSSAILRLTLFSDIPIFELSIKDMIFYIFYIIVLIAVIKIVYTVIKLPIRFLGGVFK